MDGALDMAWVDPHLAIGAAFRPVQVRELHDLGVRRVVDLRAEDRDDEVVLARHGIELLHLPTPDCCAIEDGSIERGIAWVSEALDRGQKVLVHCQYGIGRSALLCACVLVDRGLPADDALARLKRARACVWPTEEQLEALVAWTVLRSRRRGEPAPAITHRDLARLLW